MVVKDSYKPQYENIKSSSGNHIFSYPVTPNLKYDSSSPMAWNKNAVNRTAEEFRKYMLDEGALYNTPVRVTVDGKVESK